MANFVAKVKGIIKSSPLVVFSKTTCGYCARAKNLLKTMNVSFDAVELDRVESGPQMQNALAELTGQRTVPNIFIKGENIGGCDAITALHKQGKLEKKLKDAGIMA